MRFFNKVFFVSIVLIVFSPVTHAATSIRQRILLDADWRFRATPLSALDNATVIPTWRWKADDSGPTDSAALAGSSLNTTDSTWSDTITGADIFRERIGYAWLRADLPNLAGPGRVLELKVDDDADVYVNGQHLTHHEGWDTTFDVPIDSVWNANGPNTVAVLDQNTSGGGGVDLAVIGTQPPPVPANVTTDPSQPDFDDSAWRIVHLPHDYVVEGKFTPTADPSHGSLPVMTAWYRRTFVIPSLDKGKTVWIDFDGVYRDSIVYLNGIKLGEWQSGYAPFRYDITNTAIYGGKNVLAVSVDPTHPEGWWYEGGGIYRHVWLNVTDPVHVAPFGTYITSTLPEPVPGQPVPSSTETIQTTIDSLGSSPVDVVSTIIDPNGASLGNTVAHLTNRPLSNTIEQVITQSLTVNNPELWSLEQPHLYQLKTELAVGGKTVDTYWTTFGIRTIRFDPDNGFFLNGLPVKIKGVCNHQDFPGVGIAVPDSLEYWRVKQLKAFGVNGWRTSHNPPTESLLNDCDKLGILVMDENRHLGSTTAPKTSSGTTFNDPRELDAMILRDRNHPSIIIWSLCNEEWLQGSPEGAAIFSAMRQEVRRLDTTRPVSAAMNGGYNTLNGISGVEDLQGINYSPWDYANFHAQHPTIPIYGSETASTESTRGVYDQTPFSDDSGNFYGIPSLGWLSAYDQNADKWVETAENSWPQEANDPFVAGGFIWTGFDYKGEPSPFGWPDINSNFGILDVCGFPKDVYYYYEAWWSSQPLVHVFPHWNWRGSEGKLISVWVYSNAATVGLTVNGVTQGIQANPLNGHVQWTVPYEPGTVIANGYDRHGNLIGTDEIQTTGAPTALKLIPDHTTLYADGEDVVTVEVDVVDAAGRLVPTAGNLINFSVKGPGVITGVGNGNPSDHDPDKANYREAFWGKALVILGATDKPGSIRLTASSDGLTSASTTFITAAGSSAE
jgi:beta-galactosidase